MTKQSFGIQRVSITGYKVVLVIRSKPLDLFSIDLKFAKNYNSLID